MRGLTEFRGGQERGGSFGARKMLPVVDSGQSSTNAKAGKALLEIRTTSRFA